jgi:Leucine-rich repeat (LRR) protein
MKYNFCILFSDSSGHAVAASPMTISHLERGGFASLHQLEELVIENCALDRLPSGAFSGLGSRLQRLTVRQSADGGAMGHLLHVERGALAELSASLRYLDLSGNGLERLPPGELCQLKQLQQLNLSGNAIGQMADVFSDNDSSPCRLPRLENLDLSGNQLTTVDAATWATLAPELRELRLSRNYISHVSAENNSNSTNSNSSLLLLDLSHNQIGQLPASLLRDHAQLSQLLLAHNQLSQLLLTPTDQLTHLDLSGNRLVQLPANMSSFLPALSELNLSNNHLDAIHLDHLPGSLHTLRIAGNRLLNVSWPTAATSLPLLHELDLADNRLVELGAESLAHLDALTHLSLARNHLTGIHPAAFRPANPAAAVVSGLLVLDLSGNKLVEVPAALKHLSGLQTLDLGGNLIEAIEDGGVMVVSGGESSPLAALTALWRLQLHNNRISRIAPTAFAKLTSLQVSGQKFIKIYMLWVPVLGPFFIFEILKVVICILRIQVWDRHMVQ